MMSKFVLILTLFVLLLNSCAKNLESESITGRIIEVNSNINSYIAEIKNNINSEAFESKMDVEMKKNVDRKNKKMFIDEKTLLMLSPGYESEIYSKTYIIENRWHDSITLKRDDQITGPAPWGRAQEIDAGFDKNDEISIVINLMKIEEIKQLADETIDNKQYYVFEIKHKYNDLEFHPEWKAPDFMFDTITQREMALLFMADNSPLFHAKELFLSIWVDKETLQIISVKKYAPLSMVSKYESVNGKILDYRSYIKISDIDKEVSIELPEDAKSQ